MDDNHIGALVVKASASRKVADLGSKPAFPVGLFVESYW